MTRRLSTKTRIDPAFGENVMRHRIARLAVCLALAATPVAARSPESVRESFDVVIPKPPTPVSVEGREQLLYELHLTNFSQDPLEPRRVRVLDADTGRVVGDFAGEALRARLASVPAGGKGRTIEPGRRAVVFVELDLPPGEVPRGLAHRIDYAAGEQDFTAAGPEVVVDTRPAVVLGPPLAGGPWVAVHAAEWARGHRRVTYTVDGRARIPGRFAVDFVRTDDQGRTTRGDKDRPSDALGYGAEVLAVADAAVVAVRDGMAESPSIAGNPKHAIGDAAGNFVALRLPGGRTAFYEHLKPGSVRVKAGDRVRRGQVVGALGFSGDTTGPHLHFHVADGDTPLGGEGVPFAVDRFTLLGRYLDVGGLGARPWDASPTNLDPRRAAEWPGANAVVRFAE
jgi:murein DD-endopeptidase MepM/ murein hydrolase activator NlpD